VRALNTYTAYHLTDDQWAYLQANDCAVSWHSGVYTVECDSETAEAAWAKIVDEKRNSQTKNDDLWLSDCE
jgi:hypothetical protein